MKNLIHILFLIPITLFAQDWHKENRTYEYDNQNRLTKVVFSNGIVYEYQYDKLGNRLSKTIDVQLPFDNYNINTIGLTCINSNDGIINIETNKQHRYTIEIIRTIPDTEILSYELNNTNDWKLEATEFEGGRYQISITIDGISKETYEKVFFVELDEPEPLEVNKNTPGFIPGGSGKYTISITKGTSPFTIKVNNITIATTNGNYYNLDVQHGDIVEVTSSKTCEGKFIKEVNVLDAITMTPNPTSNQISFMIPVFDNTLQLNIELFDMNGRLVETFTGELNDNHIEISIQHIPIGVYLVKFPSLGETTFKIIKE